MPKHKKKKNATATGPYSSLKKSQEQSSTQVASQESDTLCCKKCTESVDQILECEGCKVWLCGTCSGLPTHVMDIIADYKQIHWLCQTCNSKINEKIQNISTDTGSSNRAISEIVAESLDKVVGQFTAALKDTQDFIKRSFEQIADAPTSDMETSHGAIQPTHVNGRNAVEAVDEYVERE